MHYLHLDQSAEEAIRAKHVPRLQAAQFEWQEEQAEAWMWLGKQKPASAWKEAGQGTSIPQAMQELQNIQFVKLWKSSYRSIGVRRIAVINLTEFCTSM